MKIKKLDEAVRNHPAEFPNRERILNEIAYLINAKNELESVYEESLNEWIHKKAKENHEAMQKQRMEQIKEENKDVIGPVELALLEPGTTFVGYHQGGYFYITEGEYKGKRIVANYGKVEEEN